jgi:hypothetical protein
MFSIDVNLFLFDVSLLHSKLLNTRRSQDYSSINAAMQQFEIQPLKTSCRSSQIMEDIEIKQKQTKGVHINRRHPCPRQADLRTGGRISQTGGSTP